LIPYSSQYERVENAKIRQPFQIAFTVPNAASSAGLSSGASPFLSRTAGGDKGRGKNDEIVIDWLKKNAIPIKSVEAGNGFADLQPLKRILEDVRVVGLGIERTTRARPLSR